MEPLYLTEYLKSHLFEHDFEENDFDLIVSDIDYEHDFDGKLVSLFAEKKEKNLNEFLGDLFETHENILWILSDFSFSSFTPLLETYRQKLTCVNLYVGMGSVGRKHCFDANDLEIMRNFECCEPLDLKNLLDLLKESKGGRYLRIPHQYFEQDIFNVDDLGIIDADNLKTVHSLSLVGYGFMGNEATIVGTGSLLSTLIQLGEILQSKEYFVDMFSLAFFADWKKDGFLQSLQKTKKLILIVDHKDNPAPFADLRAYCHKEGIRCILLCPLYDHMTTIFDEYYAEQCAFDPEHLADRILQIGL